MKRLLFSSFLVLFFPALSFALTWSCSNGATGTSPFTTSIPSANVTCTLTIVPEPSDPIELLYSPGPAHACGVHSTEFSTQTIAPIDTHGFNPCWANNDPTCIEFCPEDDPFRLACSPTIDVDCQDAFLSIPDRNHPEPWVWTFGTRFWDNQQFGTWSAEANLQTVGHNRIHLTNNARNEPAAKQCALEEVTFNYETPGFNIRTKPNGDPYSLADFDEVVLAFRARLQRFVPRTINRCSAEPQFNRAFAGANIWIKWQGCDPYFACDRKRTFGCRDTDVITVWLFNGTGVEPDNWPQEETNDIVLQRCPDFNATSNASRCLFALDGKDILPPNHPGSIPELAPDHAFSSNHQFKDYAIPFKFLHNLVLPNPPGNCSASNGIIERFSLVAASTGHDIEVDIDGVSARGDIP